MSAALEKALHYHLINTAGVASIVAAREYPAGEVPSSAPLAYVTHQAISGNQETHGTGSSALAWARYQLTAWAASSLAAHTLADAVRAALFMYRGNMGQAGATVEVKRIFLDIEATELAWPEGTGGEKGVFGVAADFRIWFVR